MTYGVTPRQAGLWRGSAGVVGDRVAADSIWGVLHREGHRLFPDELFADLFSDRGRRSVPPQVVATVMVLQRLHGKSDREAVECFEFDVRWKYAAGGLDVDFPGFSHTVLVDMRARLAGSDRPRRIFEVVLDAARGAGLVGHRRVLDSTPLYDAVATMDTVTLVRSAIRGLLAAADTALGVELRAVLCGDDDYGSSAKPRIDWDDEAARVDLVDLVARDGHRCLEVLHGRHLEVVVAEAGELLATVLGQDLAAGDDGVFRIVWGVAPDRVISTVDPDARHGHKTAARGFDGYKGHIAEDPDSEIITNTVVTPGNAGDGTVAEDLVADLVAEEVAADRDRPGSGSAPKRRQGQRPKKDGRSPRANQKLRAKQRAAKAAAKTAAKAKVYGDAAYGTGAFQQHLTDHDIDSGCRTQPPAPRPGGLFGKDLFDVDLDDDTVTCPAGEVAEVERDAQGDGIARFEDCAHCPMRADCTTSKAGRAIRVGRHEPALAEARHTQTDPAWRDDYRAVRPKIERKLGHLMFHRHGGRRARVRGRTKVDADFNLLGAAINIARLARLGLTHGPNGWATA